MFFILSKLLLFLVSPFTWMLITGYFAFFSKKAKRKKRSRISLLVISLFFSNTFIFKEACRQWEVFGTPVSKVGHYDVAVVLTGMAEYNNDLHTLSARRGFDRMVQTLTLYKQHKIKKILITGDNGYLTDNGLHEASQMKQLLIGWGIPAKDILTEEKSRNTYENAVETKKLLTPMLRPGSKILLVTSGTHMRRARACFLKAGLQFDTMSTDLYTGPKRYYTFEDFIIPSADTLNEWQKLLKEIVGYVAYALTGKI